MGQKVSDEFVVPLRRAHHREAHRASKEVARWTRLGIDPLVVSRSFWLDTRPNLGLQCEAKQVSTKDPIAIEDDTKQHSNSPTRGILG
jgi:hypothetical protein